MIDRHHLDRGDRAELTDRDLAIAAEFGDPAVDALRTVLACYEALRATEDHAPGPNNSHHATEA